MPTERTIVCPDCLGTGIDKWINPETGKEEEYKCDLCNGEGEIDNPDYWSNLLPKVIPHEEGRRALLQYFDFDNYDRKTF